MEELFQYMKTLRSHINDVADHAAKMSVEEHMQSTTIENLQKDLDSVRNNTKQVKEEADRIARAKGEICLKILEKQRKIASLGADFYTLCKTLELMQQERLSLSAKLVDRSAHYKNLTEDLSGQLYEQQKWVKTQNVGSTTRDDLVNENNDGIKDFPDGVDQSIMKDFQAAKAKFDEIKQLKSNLVLENTKLKQSVELVKAKMTDFKPELRDMSEKSLEEEIQALLSDKSGEAEYVQSLELQIMRLKEISHKVRCSCGEEYNVKLD
ncbi:hypothetical protein SASPL_103492 [Salvia splendens]|uniref:Uncharacterized protein n=1 Tax=Salvia splendens TaxID=180675 RepID=A0A8X8YHJ4_SALSN|nr:tropomyosin-like isoform X1 [Salvia splendens]XP_042035378.1 tropomyosin-like isoform X1 [Salvia splendens]KAG6431920.1 hypothetical protein SASPL_103492 [Salvia splendens]